MVCLSHTQLVKVAVSIPDPVFRAAERVSRKLGVPRSQLYARALDAYVKHDFGEEVTRQLDAVYARSGAEIDPAWEAASLEVLRREKW